MYKCFVSVIIMVNLTLNIGKCGNANEIRSKNVFIFYLLAWKMVITEPFNSMNIEWYRMKCRNFVCKSKHFHFLRFVLQLCFRSMALSFKPTGFSRIFMFIVPLSVYQTDFPNMKNQQSCGIDSVRYSTSFLLDWFPWSTVCPFSRKVFILT